MDTDEGSAAAVEEPIVSTVSADITAASSVCVYLPLSLTLATCCLPMQLHFDEEDAPLQNIAGAFELASTIGVFGLLPMRHASMRPSGHDERIRFFRYL